MSEHEYVAPSRAPFKSNSREDGRNGTVTIEIQDARHYADVLKFAEDHAKVSHFRTTLESLIGVALGYGAAKPETVYRGRLPPGFKEEGEMPIPAQPGRSVTLRIYPDGFGRERTPSFGWTTEVDGKPGLVGGMIYHHDDGRWLLHT